MKKILLGCLGLLMGLVMLSSCTGRDNGGPLDVFDQTAPGYPLFKADGIYFMPCQKSDIVGRCTKWKSESDQCVNPKGHDAHPPIVPCASIKKRK